MTEYTHTFQSGNRTVYTRDPTKADAPNKKALEASDAVLTDVAMVRDETCWCYGCDRSAVHWVREVQFDIKAEKVEHNQAIVSTRGYGGPVPGFCLVHDAIGPKQLAEQVYATREEFKWGAPANRWWVIYTDGNKTGGLIEVLDLGPGYDVVEDFTPGTDLH